MLSKDDNQRLRNQLRFVASQLRTVSIMEEQVDFLNLGYKDRLVIRGLLQKAENEAKNHLAFLAELNPVDQDHFEEV